MKKLLILLLLLAMAFSLVSCDYYEKAIRVTTGFEDPKLPENPSVSDTTDSGEKKTEPADTHDLTVPPVTTPSDDENGNGIPDHLETTEEPASTTTPVVTDDPVPPPTESPAPETQPTVDDKKLNQLFSSYVDFCNGIGTFNNVDELNPIRIFEIYRYDVMSNTESKGEMTDDNGDSYELIIETYDMKLIDEITRNMLGRCYDYSGLVNYDPNFPGCEESFSFDGDGNVICTVKFYGGAGFGPRPYFEYVDYEKNGDEYILNILYMDIDEFDEPFPVKYYKAIVTHMGERFLLQSFSENPDKTV